MAAATNTITWWQWLVHVNDVKQLWTAQPTYLISQAVFVFAGLITLLHAVKKGGRWPYFWLGTVLHGLYTDNFWRAISPESDNLWHSQTPVMFFGSRHPLHSIFVYPAFLYNAAYAVSKLRLPRYAESFAVGLVTVLINLPYDLVAVKFVHRTWHDTDPSIFDRHYWVPWTSYFFYATFTASFFFLFGATRRWLAPKAAQWESAGKKAEWKALLLSVLLGMPGGLLPYVALLQPLRYVYNIHAEVAVFVLLSVFAVFVINGLLSEREKVKERLTTIDYVLNLQLAVHFVIYWVFVVFFNPEREWSLGLHEPVGPCNEVAVVKTPFGQMVKRKFFCAESFDEGYFDFSCVGGQKPQFGASWYVVCGKPFENRPEYITLLSSILVVAAGVFFAMYAQTSPAAPQKKLKTK
ncbi:uncharacterized protein LOC114354273 [Ostrinia furnacalis]|uniref:uncharacterized protein LOC114354273 n=1 Tax=Ostrinia furnacalis TaxID=93504 RepID=UPI00103AC1DE|nr:uncharacterized protein LOC114354273 [Ostrinia furnacalis]